MSKRILITINNLYYYYYLHLKNAHVCILYVCMIFTRFYSFLVLGIKL